MPTLAALPLLIRLLVPAAQVPQELDLTALQVEIERVWGGHLSLAVEVTAAPEPARESTIWLRFADQLGPDARPHALAWTPFTGGRPGGVITVSPRRVREAIGATPHAAAFTRAAGRVVSHELGHILLARQDHSHHGLMREAFSRADLTRAEVGALQAQ